MIAVAAALAGLFLLALTALQPLIAEVPAVKFDIPLKACCGEVTGKLAGDECDCLQFAADAAELFAGSPLLMPVVDWEHRTSPKPTHPTPMVLVLRDGLLRRVDGATA